MNKLAQQKPVSIKVSLSLNQNCENYYFPPRLTNRKETFGERVFSGAKLTGQPIHKVIPNVIPDKNHCVFSLDSFKGKLISSIVVVSLIFLLNQLFLIRTPLSMSDTTITSNIHFYCMHFRLQQTIHYRRFNVQL